MLLASSLLGTECLLLLVVWKANRPRCVNKNSCLPVEYRAKRKAWVTTDIFQVLLQHLDRCFSTNKRKLLLVDDCSTHTSATLLECIKLVFLPPNATTALQPLDQGIIQYVKAGTGSMCWNGCCYARRRGENIT